MGLDKTSAVSKLIRFAWPAAKLRDAAQAVDVEDDRAGARSQKYTSSDEWNIGPFMPKYGRFRNATGRGELRARQRKIAPPDTIAFSSLAARARA